jgi:hypothetical protein
MAKPHAAWRRRPGRRSGRRPESPPLSRPALGGDPTPLAQILHGLRRAASRALDLALLAAAGPGPGRMSWPRRAWTCLPLPEGVGRVAARQRPDPAPARPRQDRHRDRGKAVSRVRATRPAWAGGGRPRSRGLPPTLVTSTRNVHHDVPPASRCAAQRLPRPQAVLMACGRVPSTQVAEWAGHAVVMLDQTYAEVIAGQETAALARIPRACGLKK